MCSNMHFLVNVRKSYDGYSLCLLYLGRRPLYAQRCQSIFTCHVHLLIRERSKERQGHVSQLSISLRLVWSVCPGAARVEHTTYNVDLLSLFLTSLSLFFHPDSSFSQLRNSRESAGYGRDVPKRGISSLSIASAGSNH